MEFEGQVALVTGGSRGIGRAIAVRLAEAGCDIALTYRSATTEAEQVAERIAGLGRKVELYQGDISDPKVPQTIVNGVRASFGRIDVLVNNAGITRDELLVNQSLEDIEQVLATNLIAPMLTVQAVAPLMLRRRYGRIVNISSSAASKPGRGQSNYAAAKGGLEAFTKAMAVELASRGILVNAVAPGVINTEMTDAIRSHGEDEIMRRLLVKSYAEPETVADAVVHLAGPRNTYTTGEVLHVDGGLKMA
ncbi:putative 3-oxoacyl-[acyl-carrier protein] reductase [Streptomyces caniferus]|uniref:Putative 3-oxoacyl-[acyl-carrier protein] reductase n=1 Tax=Streptomyces caniferus TaxID=285557 RepID=A0A640S723_9ACTN|nr:3-oxoacyl-ACP reductase family protein [Streptomyces caniferus]GFE05425.1 putative 3-oxoacyl-[acyl-carrier protein] reductase [Streptomyces caniferus]